MLRKFSLCLVVLMMFASVSMASPLTDYSAGKTSIDVGWWSPDVKYTDYTTGYSNSVSGKSNSRANFGVTTGLGNKWAIQYNQYNFYSNKVVNSPPTFTNNNVNVLYKIDKGVSAFIGHNQASWKFDNGNKTDNKNVMILGVTGTSEIGKNLNLYGSVAGGKDYSSYEVGLGYTFAKGLELNVGYKDINVKHMPYGGAYSGWQTNADVKGFTYGLSYKF